MLDLTEKEKKVLKILINGLPICERPYYKIAQNLDLSEEEVLNIIKSLIEKKIIRRLGITLRHNLAGIEGNAMVAWKVPEEKVEEVGNALASLPFVSHCYLRKTYEDWPYNLYTMLHAKNKEELFKLIQNISEKFKLSEYEILFTKKEIVRKHAQYLL